MLTYLNNKFINSSFKTKIELYLLPLMLFYLVYYFSLNVSNNKESSEIKNNIDLKHYENRKFIGSFLELFSTIEISAKQENIQVKSLNNKMNIIELKAYGKKENMSKLIKDIENINNFTNIDSLNIYDKNDSSFYSFNLKIDMNKFYIKKLEKQKKELKKEDIENKIQNINKKEKQTIIKIDYKLKAIIDSYVLINDTWIQVGENINDYVLVDVNRNFVVLENDNKKLKLELVHDEYLKNIY